MHMGHSYLARFCVLAVAMSAIRVTVASAQTAGERIAVATTAARAIRTNYPSGPVVLLYRNDATLATKISPLLGATTASLQEVAACEKSSNLEPCLLSRVAVALEVFRVALNGDSASVTVIARSSPVPSHDRHRFRAHPMQYRSFTVRMRRRAEGWVVVEKRPGAIS
jgi:hypothetical protein